MCVQAAAERGGDSQGAWAPSSLGDQSGGPIRLESESGQSTLRSWTELHAASWSCDRAPRPVSSMYTPSPAGKRGSLPPTRGARGGCRVSGSGPPALPCWVILSWREVTSEHSQSKNNPEAVGGGKSSMSQCGSLIYWDRGAEGLLPALGPEWQRQKRSPAGTLRLAQRPTLPLTHHCALLDSRKSPLPPTLLRSPVPASRDSRAACALPA